MAAGQLPGAGRGRALRRRRLEPAVRDLARERIRLPGQRPRPRPCQRGARPRVPVGARGGRLRHGDDQLGAGRRRPRRRAEALGGGLRLRRLALPHGLRGPLASAAAWNRDAEGDEFERRVDPWLDYYRGEQIGGIAYGTIVLRRRAGGGWFRADELPDGREAAGAHLELLFANQDALAGLDDAALLDRTLSVCPHTVFEHENRSGPDGWTTVEAALAIRGGIAFRASLDGHSAAMVAELGPGRRVRDVIEAAAAKRGVPVAEFGPPALALLRRMLEFGFVEPAR
ncbi:MAG: DUF7782 domain-containing protein [Gaiellaceae bacterium]